MSVRGVLKFAKDKQAPYVNVRFTDLVGAWHHLTFPIEELNESSSLYTSVNRSLDQL